MKCMECGSTDSSFDDRLGYHICVDCGLVLNVEIFEESHTPIARVADSKYNLGSTISNGNSKQARKHRFELNHLKSEGKTKYWSEGDIAAHNMCMMYLSYYRDRSNISLRDRVEHYYQELQKNRVLVGFPTDVRAAGLAYFILKDEGIFVSLKHLAKLSLISKSKIMRVAKKIAKFYRKSHIFSQRNIHEIVSACLDIADGHKTDRTAIFLFVEYVNDYYETINMRMGNGEIGAAIYIANKITGFGLTQEQIRNAVNTSDSTLRRHIGLICVLIEIDRSKLHNYEIQEIIGGIKK